MNVNFYVRAPKCSKNGTAPLELCINIEGKRKFIATQYRLTPAEWKKKRKAKALTDYMDMMRARVNEILTDMLRAGEPVTAQALSEYMKSGGYKSYSVEDLFNEYLDILRQRVGKNLTKGVYRKYELVRDLFFEDIDRSRECERVLTPANILRFKVKVEGKYEQATAAGYLRKLKSFVFFAIDNGRLTVNPFQGVKIRRGEKPIITMKAWEQKAFLSGKLENESLEKVRDFSIMQLSTGTNFSDCSLITKEDIQERDGVYYIEKPRKKTGKVFTSVIIEPERFMAILDKYDGKAPVICDQKLNAYLKVIGDLLRINTRLTTQVFRRTYATNLLNSGVRIDTVAAALGHDTKVCSKYYAKIKTDTVLSEISKVI